MNKKEEKQKFMELANIVSEAGKLISEVMLSSSPDSTKLDKILALESKGDELKDMLNIHFAKEQNTPYLALDRAKLLRRIDDCLDEFARSARTVREFSEFLPATLMEDGKELLSLIQQASTDLSEAIHVIFNSFKDALELVKQIENARDRALDLGSDLISKKFKEVEDWKTFEATERIVKRIHAIMAILRDTAEVLQLMAYKYVN